MSKQATHKNDDRQHAAGMLAKRWAVRCRWCVRAGNEPECSDWIGRPEGLPPLHDHEREQLFDWLRARADEYRPHADGHGLDSYAEWLGMDLGEPFEGNPALTLLLLQASGVQP